MPDTGYGIALIAAERLRQINEEGWTRDHDNQHDWEELVKAGLAYSLSSIALMEQAKDKWPWKNPLKPKDPLRDLVRAGALVAAAIDRYQGGSDGR